MTNPCAPKETVEEIEMKQMLPPQLLRISEGRRVLKPLSPAAVQNGAQNYFGFTQSDRIWLLDSC